MDTEPEVTNCIFYGNTSGAGNQIYLYDDNSDPNFTNCDIQGGTAAFGIGSGGTYTGNYSDNIDENPLFINPTAGTGTEYNGLAADWTLQSDNPCINTGTSDTTGMNIPQLDLAQNPRVYNDIRIDIGVYEYQNNPPEINTQSFNVDENSNNSTVVATATASDIDGNENSFSIIDGNTNGAFAISSSGQITVANTNALDYETVPQQKFELTIQITDNGIGNLTDTTIITINLNDVNDAPVINPFSFDIDENSLNSSVVGTVSGTDEDSPAQNLTYSIVGGTYGNKFSINTTTGEITVTDSTPLNYETNPVITITVRIQDDGTGNLYSNASVTINLNDVNDYPLISNQAFTIGEHSAVSYSIGTVAANDVDVPTQNLTYSIIAGNEDDAFAINGTTGELTVNDSDSVDYEIEQSKIITVQVVDDGTGTLSNQAQITVNLSNINDNAPIFNDTIVNVNENVPEATLIVSLIATDADNLNSLSYSIVSGDDNEIFHLQNGNGHNLYLTKYDSINYELYQQFELVISVTDGDSIREANVTINVNDLNEWPILNADEFNVDEMAANNTLVGTISANDPDIGQTLYYYIIYGNHNNAFVLDSVSGELTVLDYAKLDHEGSYSSYNLQIRVKDNGTPEYYADNYFYILVNDVNEAPIVEAQTFSFFENANIYTSIGQVTATHEDNGQELLYNFISGNEFGIFNLNLNSGLISLQIPDSIDFESKSSYEFIIEVSDNYTPPLSDTTIITINIKDINEPPTVEDQVFYVDENTAVYIVVDTVLVSDPDANESFYYQFVDWNYEKAFGLNSSTGEIFINNAVYINYEENTVFNYEVLVGDFVGNTASASITININDINETPIITPYLGFAIDENSPVNTIVGVVDVETDAGETLSFSITNGNSCNVFGINSPTGEIYVSNEDSLNYEFINYFDLTISATDNSAENLTGEGIISISVSNVYEAPVINAQAFHYFKDPYNYSYIGTVVATDDDRDQIHYFITEGNTNDAFYIQENTGEIYIQQPQEINYDNIPEYNLIVKADDYYGLSDTAIITITIAPTDIDMLDIANIVSVYPNPAKEFINLDFKMLANDIDIEIFDVKNQLLQKNHFSGLHKNHRERIDLSSFAKGLYFIKASYNEKIYFGKIIIE